MAILNLHMINFSRMFFLKSYIYTLVSGYHGSLIDVHTEYRNIKYIFESKKKNQF